jgi:hypothetical protein
LSELMVSLQFDRPCIDDHLHDFKIRVTTKK